MGICKWKNYSENLVSTDDKTLKIEKEERKFLKMEKEGRQIEWEECILGELTELTDKMKTSESPGFMM